MLSKGTWAKIALVVALCVLLCAGCVSCSYGCTPVFGGIGGWMAGNQHYVEVGSASIAAESVQAIELDWAAGKVEFASSEGDDIELREWSNTALRDDQKMRWDLKDGVLRIDYCSAALGLFGCTPNLASKRLVIGIPGSAELERVRVNGASGEYDLGHIRCGTLELDLASGSAWGSELAVDSLDAHLTSGNMDLSGTVNSAAKLNMTSGTASLAFQELLPDNIRIDTTSGDATLFVPQESGFSAYVDKTSGSFECLMDDVHTYDGAYVRGDGACQMKIGMTSGKVTLEDNKQG